MVVTGHVPPLARLRSAEGFHDAARVAEPKIISRCRSIGWGISTIATLHGGKPNTLHAASRDFVATKPRWVKTARISSAVLSVEQATFIV